MIPTSAEGTMPHIQIQRDCSTTFVILDSAGMDTTVQVRESMIALPFQRVKYTWPPNLLVHKNFDSPFFFFLFFFQDTLLDNPSYDLHFFNYLFIFWTD